MLARPRGLEATPTAAKHRRSLLSLGACAPTAGLGASVAPFTHVAPAHAQLPLRRGTHSVAGRRGHGPP
eukprot:13357060-Alexandrium_andersonii.AAC.1